MENNEKENLQLPENAFRELKDGEEYKPLMSPDKVYPEVNFWSVTWGIVMAVIFSAAAAYLGLKVGQVFEAAIPIAIIAVGVSTATKRNKALGENVIIQSIGGYVAAVDTTSFALQKKWKVGSYPEGLVIGGGNLYVATSFEEIGRAHV